MKSIPISHRALGLMLLTAIAWGVLGCISPESLPTQEIQSSLVVSFPTSTPRPTGARLPTAAWLKSATSTFPPIPTITVTYPASVRQRPYIVTLRELIGERSQQVTMRSLLYLPADYETEPSRRWPMILFLHGSGEAGNDLNLLKKVMLPKYLENHADFPFIVISPQIPAPGSQSLTIPMDPKQYMETYGWNPWIDRLNLLVDAMQADYRVDTNRVYLTGLSLGGFGTWNYALRYPDRFAAIVPVAGRYQFYSHALPDQICNLKELPVWAFHGGQDTSVMPWQTLTLVEALKACGGNVRLTLYPDSGHGIWDQVYTDPELFEWLLVQHK